MARTIIRRPGGDQTREKILAVSERLFAAAGYDAVSLRQVGAEADVPFASVTYHFKTKLGLYKAIFDRRISSFSRERLERLRAIELGDDVVANFNAIADAFVGPMISITVSEGQTDFAQLLARETHDPNEAERGIVAEHLDPLAFAAVDLLRRAAPDAPLAHIYHAYQFATGALSVNYNGTKRIDRISQGLSRSEDVDQLTDELVRFIAAGLLISLRPDFHLARTAAT